MIRKFLKEQNLSECSLGICCIPECIKDFLQRNNAAGFPFICFPHNPIGALAYKNLLKFTTGIVMNLPSRRLISYRSIKCDSTSFVSTILKWVLFLESFVWRLYRLQHHKNSILGRNLSDRRFWDHRSNKSSSIISFPNSRSSPPSSSSSSKSSVTDTFVTKIICHIECSIFFNLELPFLAFGVSDFISALMICSDFWTFESALWLVVMVGIGFGICFGTGGSGFDSGDGFDFFTCTSSFSLLLYIYFWFINTNKISYIFGSEGCFLLIKMSFFFLGCVCSLLVSSSPPLFVKNK